jgi:hypothetical protein
VVVPEQIPNRGVLIHDENGLGGMAMSDPISWEELQEMIEDVLRQTQEVFEKIRQSEETVEQWLGLVRRRKQEIYQEHAEQGAMIQKQLQDLLRLMQRAKPPLRN